MPPEAGDRAGCRGNTFRPKSSLSGWLRVFRRVPTRVAGLGIRLSSGEAEQTGMGYEKITQELEWIPFYIDRILTSSKYQCMKDYQRGWYMHLLLISTRSKPLGYVRKDENIWQLAGARSKQFFDKESAVVLACFKCRDISGQSYIYNERLICTLEEQLAKLNKRKRRENTSPLLFSVKNSSFLGISSSIQDSLAFEVCNHLGLAATKGNVSVIGESILSLSKQKDLTLKKAAEFIVFEADLAVSIGIHITRFWFEDSMWKGNRNGGPVSKKQSIVNRNRQKISNELLGSDYKPNAGQGCDTHGERTNGRGKPSLAGLAKGEESTIY